MTRAAIGRSRSSVNTCACGADAPTAPGKASRQDPKVSSPRGTRKVSSADLGAIAAAFGTAKGVESKPVYEDVVRGLGNRSRVKAFVQALRDEGLTPHLEKDDDTFVNSLFLPGAEIGLRDADVTPDPDPVFGVAEVFFAPSGHMLAARVGDVAAAVGDLAAMGALSPIGHGQLGTAGTVLS